MTIWRMRIACWIPKAADTHSEYVTLIAFPRQAWLRERDLMSRDTYSVCHVTLLIFQSLAVSLRITRFNNKKFLHGARFAFSVLCGSHNR